MTERSLYPEGVPVHDDDLRRTELSKSAQIKQRLIDAGAFQKLDDGQTFLGGVIDGLRITLNSDNTLIDISAGAAYVPNGERIVVTTDQTAVALSDYTDTTVNNVCLVYTETLSEPEGHETNGTSPNTRAEAAFRVVVYTDVELLALSDTSTDLAVDALDRLVIIGTVLGNALSGGTPINLAAAEITQTLLLEPVAVEYTTDDIPGVNLVAARLTSDTEYGAGELYYNGATNWLTWHPNGDTVGANVLATEGAVTLVSTSTAELDLDVSLSLLQGAHATNATTVGLTLSQIYGVDTGPVFSAVDREHRNDKGSGARTATNPHGLGGQELGSSFIRFLKEVIIGEGTAAEPDPDLRGAAARLTLDTSGVGAVRTQAEHLRQSTSSDEGDVRIYHVEGTTAAAVEITKNARWDGDQGATPWQRVDGADSWRLVIGADDAGLVLQKYAVGAVTAFADASWRTLWKSDSTTALLDFANYFTSSEPERELPRIQMHAADAGTRTLFLESRATSTTPRIMRAYRNGTDGVKSELLELTCNAQWDESTALWTADVNTAEAYKISLSRDDFRVYSRSTTTTPWNDLLSGGTGWDNNEAHMVFDFNTSGLTLSRPAPTVPVANTLYADTMLKAWAIIDVNRHIDTPTVVLRNSVGVDSVVMANNSVEYRGPGLLVNFAVQVTLNPGLANVNSFVPSIDAYQEVSGGNAENWYVAFEYEVIPVVATPVTVLNIIEINTLLYGTVTDELAGMLPMGGIGAVPGIGAYSSFRKWSDPVYSSGLDTDPPLTNFSTTRLYLKIWGEDT